MKNKGNRPQLLRLHKRNPHCYYCGVLTVLPESGVNTPGESVPNMATRDHVYSRWHPIRYTNSPDRSKVVLACYKCNHSRNELEQQSIPKEVKMARGSGNLILWDKFELQFVNGKSPL